MTLRIRVKAVPGAKQDKIAGVLGDRLKVRISAPPEGGKANAAIAASLASVLGLKPSQVSIESGKTNPEKVFTIEGIDAASLDGALGSGTADAVVVQDPGVEV